MNPNRLRYSNGVLCALPRTEMSKTDVANSRGMTSSFLKFLFSRSLTHQAVFALLVCFAFAGSYRANAAIADAPSARVLSPAKIAWHSCEQHIANLDCAEVQVPLDWNHPDGPKITLSVARHRASKTNERIGSLFVNYGGPGVPGVPAVLAGGEGLDQLSGGRFDVIGWDPRGTGGSTHVRCFENEKSMEQFWGQNWTIPSTPKAKGFMCPRPSHLCKGALP